MTSPVLLYQYNNELVFNKSKTFTVPPSKQVNLQTNESLLLSDSIKNLLNGLEINTDQWKSVSNHLKPVENPPFIQEYINNTIEKSVYYCDLKVLETFEINRPEDKVNFRKDLHNKRLLWHGTPEGNIGPIIQNGFKLECAANGFFGKGIYFADCCTKSLNYCRYILTPFSLFDFSKTNTYYLFLCEVALGEMKRANYSGFKSINKYSMGISENSVCGEEKWSTEEGLYNKEGVMICSGKLKQTNSSASLKYDEFIVYDTNQIRLRYLVKVKSVHTNFQLFKRQMRSLLIVIFLSFLIMFLSIGASSLLCYWLGITFSFQKVHYLFIFLQSFLTFVLVELICKIMEWTKTVQRH